MKRLVLLLVLTPLAMGCSPDALPRQGQIRIQLTTDAVLPPPSGVDLGDDEPAPLFDRVRIDLYEPGAAQPCEGCARDFLLDRNLVDAGRASFGVVPAAGVAGYRARARLFLSAAQHSEQPAPEATIEVTAALPVVNDGDLVDVVIMLPTDSVGVPIGSLEEPSMPTLGSAPSGLVGTWWGARRIPCVDPPGPGEVCVVGGAFWMGNPRAAPNAFTGEGSRQRLVVVSPFYLDAREVTAGEFAAVAENTVDGSPLFWELGESGTSLRDWCTWTIPDFGPINVRADLSLNCTPWVTGQHYCELRGAELPTEAQLEYVAGRLAGNVFVWGDDAPSCGDAVFARGGVGVLGGTPGCLAGSGIGLPLPAARSDYGRDRVVIPVNSAAAGSIATGEIVDLAGNVREWARDAWNRSDEPCWNRSGLYIDPVCSEPSPADGDAHRAFGGAWTDPGEALAAASRVFYPTTEAIGHVVDVRRVVEVGFRCARPAVAP